MIKKISIFLQSKTTAFSVSNKDIEFFKGIFPYVSVRNCLTSEEFLDSLPDADAVVTWVFKKEWYNLSNSLRIVATPAAGSDWIEKDSQNMVKIFHGSYHGILMSESIISAILFLNHKFYKTLEMGMTKRWEREFLSETKPISVQKILIAGYGSIGKIVAKKLSSLTSNIYGLKRSGTGRTDVYGTKIIDYKNFMDMIDEFDHIVNILPATTQTQNFFSKKIFDRMKSSCCFYNFGRGATVDEEDLIVALENNSIKAALLDTVKNEPLHSESEIWNVENLFITHHSSAVYDNYIELYFKELKKLGVLSEEHL